MGDRDLWDRAREIADHTVMKERYSRLVDRVAHLEAIVARAIEVLDGNDDEPCGLAVERSELVRKLTEHLYAYWEDKKKLRALSVKAGPTMETG